ncbi:unnamed protein product [Paramecium sonneborni]|uniref:Uncharacterized protein n=1 Tax=Paramecium sonneborni TaxID=65129 RepID=A0A8S1QC75_9CILI|nr:unnamed protein product [Paramecium sonneborni]
MSMEIDELAETIMDCVMNSHIISEEGRNYIEQHIPTKPPETDVQSARFDLYEKTGKERIQKVALVFKTHQEARRWYSQFKQHATTHQKVHKKAALLDNVLFKYGDYGKSLFQYAEYICEFIDQQPLCVFQHMIPDHDLRLSETHPYYFKIHWAFRGFMTPQTSSMVKAERNPSLMNKLKDEEIPRKLVPIDTYMRSLMDKNNNSSEDDDDDDQ